jgi:hypothetical protein
MEGVWDEGREKREKERERARERREGKRMMREMGCVYCYVCLRDSLEVCER